MTSNLATQLREGTSKSHSMAENVSFVKSFLGGVIDKESYRKLVSNLYFVYSAMEEAMEKNKDNSFIKPIYFRELNRRRSLEILVLHYPKQQKLMSKEYRPFLMKGLSYLWRMHIQDIWEIFQVDRY